jgi:hypothetical protein
VEGFYLRTLDALEPIVQRRPFLLGERPTEADFGFFASLFRHFFSDPAPARIMRERAPGVQEWVARTWNLRPARIATRPMPDRLPDDLGPLLDAVARDYLPYLDANAAAWAKGEKSVTHRVRDTTFTEPVKPYRVWCRDRLHARFVALEPAARAEVERVLGAGDAAKRLATPSPRPVECAIPPLPLTGTGRARPVDSWWR